VFGAVLLVALPVVIITGLLDYIAYGPQFGQTIPADVGWLRLPRFDWPTRPSWLFALTEGLHVGLGLVIIPVVLAKLWSVVPKLFAWPPARSVAQVLERLSLLLLVGGILFEIATGALNIQYDYLFGFSFYTAHYYGAWVFIAGFVVHVALKLPHMITGLRSRSMRAELRTPLASDPPGAARPLRPGRHRPGPGDDEQARRAGPRRWRRVAPRGPVRRAGHRRGRAQCRAAVAARAELRRAQRLPGQPHRRRGRDHPSRHRRRLGAHALRVTPDEPDPGDAAGHAATHRGPADRVRRGVGDDPDVAGRATGRPRRRRRNAGTRVRDGGVP